MERLLQIRGTAHNIKETASELRQIGVTNCSGFYKNHIVELLGKKIGPLPRSYQIKIYTSYRSSAKMLSY